MIPTSSPRREDDADFHDEPEDEDDYPDEEVEDKPARRRKEKPEKASKPPRERKPKEPKEAKPNVFTKLYDLYFAPLTNKEALEAPVDPANPRRRRRKTKSQIFKEVYLPPLIACVCLILILSFVIGAISNAIEKKRVNDAIKQNEIQASISNAQAAEEGVSADYGRGRRAGRQLMIMRVPLRSWIPSRILQTTPI